MSQWGQMRTFTGSPVNGDNGYRIDVIPLVRGPVWSDGVPKRDARIDGLTVTHITGNNERADRAFKIISKHYGTAKYGEWLDCVNQPDIDKQTDANEVHDYLVALLNAGINVPPSTLCAAERLVGNK